MCVCVWNGFGKDSIINDIGNYQTYTQRQQQTYELTDHKQISNGLLWCVVYFIYVITVLWNEKFLTKCENNRQTRKRWIYATKTIADKSISFVIRKTKVVRYLFHFGCVLKVKYWNSAGPPDTINEKQQKKKKKKHEFVLILHILQCIMIQHRRRHQLFWWKRGWIYRNFIYSMVAEV